MRRTSSARQRAFDWLVIVRFNADMSITIELPPDVEKRLAGLPDLGQRVADFLRGQAELEQWREQRYSAKAREIVRESLAEAEAAKAKGISREEAFREFFEVYDRITAQIAEKQ